MFEIPLDRFLSQQRSKARLTQAEFSQDLGLSRSRLAQLECGSRPPNDAERALLHQHLGELRGYYEPTGYGHRLVENGLNTLPPSQEFHPAQERPSDIRYFKAVSAYPDFVRRLTIKIKARADFLDCQYHCGQVALESVDEVVFLLRLLEAGALPVYCAPNALGDLPQSIIDPASREPVGHKRFPGFALPGDVYFFQVTFSTPGYYRVDVLRWNNGWSVVEIDGGGHLSTYDFVKSQAIGLPTRRLTPADIMGDTFELRRAA